MKRYWRETRNARDAAGNGAQTVLTLGEMANPRRAAAQAWGYTTAGHKLADAEPAWVISPWSKITLQPSLSTHRQMKVGCRVFC